MLLTPNVGFKSVKCPASGFSSRDRQATPDVVVPYAPGVWSSRILPVFSKFYIGSAIVIFRQRPAFLDSLRHHDLKNGH